MRCQEKAQHKSGAAKLQRRVAMNGGARLLASPGIRRGSLESGLAWTLAPRRSWVASVRFFACMGAVILEHVRRSRQRAAGILPAEGSEKCSAGKMPVAHFGSWKMPQHSFCVF